MATDIQLHQGDCLEVLKTLNDNSIDSVVTDPPYGINFMGKKWDYNVPNVEVWQQVIRVLKPGGHALVACGTRTQHRMAVNLEDAGFEIRDIVAWVYGSGFPKSQNIGKAVDKLQGNERQEVGKYNFPDGSKRTKFDKCTNPNPMDWESNLGEKRMIVTKGNSTHEGWGSALKPSIELFTLCRKPLAEKTIAKNVLKYNTGGINIDGCRVMTNGETPSGSGKGSKNSIYSQVATSQGNGGNKTPTQGRFPANFIHDGSDEVKSKFPDTKSGNIKSGTYQNRAKKTNVAYGEYKNDGAYNPTHEANKGSASRFFYVAKFEPEDNKQYKQGRFPANFIHDGSDQVVSEFPDTNRVDKRTTCKSSTGMFFKDRKTLSRPQDNGGSASRFFYCAKASKSERNKGLEGFNDVVKHGTYAQDEWSRQNMGNTPDNKRQPVKNNHPTVKPIKLMKYLCRLITPVNGIVLDPYMGSGSTGIAAQEEGFNFTGIELDKDYFEIAKARINAKEAQEKLF